jgi:hypothetical protein
LRRHREEPGGQRMPSSSPREGADAGGTHRWELVRDS